MKTPTIKWEKSVVLENTYSGKVGQLYLFHLERRGVRKHVWQLQARPIHQDIFPYANYWKSFKPAASFGDAKHMAKLAFEKFIQLFLEE
jgi:hypothetical protein